MTSFFYVSDTIRMVKGGVHLFDVPCELRIEYDLPDGRDGPVEWRLTAFYFAESHVNPPKYVEIYKPDPLFDALIACVDQDWLGERVLEDLAANEIIDEYVAQRHVALY